MGLTIHYELALPRAMTPKQVMAKVEALRQCCLDLPFQEVGPLVDLQGDACSYEKNKDENLRWLLIQGGKTLVRFHYTSKGTPGRGHVKDNPDGYSNARVQVFASRLIGFSTSPGEGCEPANFGLGQFPEATEIRGNKYPYVKRSIPVPAGKHWSWGSFCKTQYANDPRCGGLGNFLRCHLLVVAVLDAAKKLGFRVKVHDEGDYWPKRDLDALGKAVGEMDAAMAGFRGALKDALGDKIETAMDGRPDFERLEAKGRTKAMDDLARLVRETMRKRRKGR